MEQQKHDSGAFNRKLNGFGFVFFIYLEYLCSMEFHNSKV